MNNLEKVFEEFRERLLETEELKEMVDYVKQQELIDILFAIVMTMHDSAVSMSRNWVADMSRAQIAAWAADQLRAAGYNTHPMGQSWGVLKLKEKVNA